MGVPGLQKYLSNNLPNHVREINIIDEIQTAKVQKLLIVIDLLNLQEMIFDCADRIYGGQFDQYNKQIDHFFKKLNTKGVTLVFFMDRKIQKDRMQHCLNDRLCRYKLFCNLFDKIERKRDPQQIQKEISGVLQLPLVKNITAIVEKYGKVYTSISYECDAEMARYASKHKAYAIISKDTDFLIYKGDWKLWSSNIDLNKFSTKEYNNLAVRKALNLEVYQMPLFATLAGNDIVRSEQMKGFQNQIKKYNDHKFNHLADIVREYYKSQPLSEKDAKDLSKMVFDTQYQNDGIDLIYKSIKNYDYDSMQGLSEGNNFIAKVANNTNYYFNYRILSDHEQIINMHPFDLRYKGLTNFNDLIIPVIKRIMGVLLKNSNEENISRLFYIKREHGSKYEKVELKPEFPSENIPPLPELLFTPYGQNDCLDKLRIHLLCWQISSKLKPEEVEKFPKDDIVNALTVFYLYKFGNIAIEAADCLTAANHCPENIDEKVNRYVIQRINARDARIAFLFTLLQDYINHCFYAVGMNEIDPLIKFNGLYFHKLRQLWNFDSVRTNAMANCAHLRFY